MPVSEGVGDAGDVPDCAGDGGGDGRDEAVEQEQRQE